MKEVGMLKSTVTIISISLISTLIGCSSPPTIGQQMIAQGSDTQVWGEKWQDGQSLVDKGNKKIKHGKKLIASGKDEVSDGKNMVKKGKKIMKKSENAFHEKFPEVELGS